MVYTIRLIFLMLIFAGFQLTALAQDDAAKIKNLAKAADVIVAGKVTHKESHWNDSKTRIYTKTTLQVDESLKGAENQLSLEITTLGGEVGDVGEIYTHMPTFEAEEEVLVFLKADKDKKGYQVMNGEEGKIPLRDDSAAKGKVTGSNVKFDVLKSKIRGYLHEK